VKVVSPIEDRRRFAQPEPGDFIIKIDDASVKGMSLNDAVKAHARQAEDDHPADHHAQGRGESLRGHVDAPTSFACKA